MKLALDFEVQKWLCQLGVLKPSQAKSNGKVELDESTSKLFLNGLKIGETLVKLVEPRGIHLNSLTEAMKNQHTPGVRLFNWNLLQEAFQKINLPLDNDIKNLIVQGDAEMINELLKDVMEHYNTTLKPKTQQSIRSSEDSFDPSKKPPSRINVKLPNTKYESQSQTNELDLEQVDLKRPLSETSSLLDFLITGLSRHLSLKPPQAASLLSNGNKYLAHILVKGLKGEFDPLTNWLSDVYANLARIFSFFEQQDANVGIFLSAIKPGLLSKEQEVTLWTLRINGRVFFELSELEMHQLGYEWFTKDNGGLAATFMCMQRHPQLINNICELYSQVARYNMIDFFTVQFKKQLAEKCVDMFNVLMEPIYALKSLKDEFIQQGIIQYWAQQAMKLADSEQTPVKLQGLQYLTLNWMLYPIQFEEDQNYPNQYLFLMKKATRESQNVLKFFSLNSLFRLLDKLATERNPFAAVLYKKLTFSLIENYNDLEVREFMLQNFIFLIQKYSSIPIDILLEPFVKQVMMNDANINLPDMLMFKFLASHPKMKIRMAILLLDLLSKVYLNKITFSHLSFGPIQILMARFAESQLLREYAFKLVKISLALHYGSLKSKKQYPRVKNDLSVLTVLQQQSNDHDILEAQKRAQIIELVKFIINLQQDELNEQIKPLLCHFYIELQNINVRDKGIIALLNMFGNAEMIVNMIKEQWDQEKQQQEEILKQSQLLIENEFVSEPQETPHSQKTKQSTPIKPQKNDDPFSDMRKQELEDEKQFLQNHGVGFKKRIVELEKGKSIAPASKQKKAQVDPRVLENIANIKLKKEEELLKKQQEEEEKRKKFEVLQKKAQQEIVKRMQQPEKSEERKVELIDLDEFEQMDLDSLNVSMKRHHKAIKYLFSKYSNTTNHATKKQYFNELQEQFECIKFSDILRMCKDYSLNIQKEELQGMVKTINQKYGETKLDQLDMTNFEKLMVQLALKTEPNIFQRYPAGSCIDQMITTFGQIAKTKGENSLIFLDPDNLTLDPDRETITLLNQQLQIQDVPVPPRFKKVTEKQFHLKYSYRHFGNIGLPQSWLDCHEIVNMIVQETFKSAVMEPLSEVRLVNKVKSKPIQEPVQKPQRDLSQKRVTNKAIEDKMQKKQEEEQQKIEAEERRKRHQEKLKQEYLRKKKEKEEEEERKKQEERQLQIEKLEKERKYQELLKKEAEDKKNKLREYKEKQAEENKVKEQQNIELQKQKQEQERRQREEFQKKQKEEIKKLIEEKQKEFKDKETQEKHKELKKQEELKEWKNNVENMLKEEQEQRAREKQIQAKISALFQSTEIQSLLKNYEKQLNMVYHAYQEYTDWKIENAEQEKDLLQFKGFTNFASQFNIYPAIITPDDAQLIFRSLSRERERQQLLINEKNGFTQTAAKGMNFREFEQALLRIAIKGQKYFDLLAERYHSDMKTMDMIAMKKDKAVDEAGPLEKREDLYQAVDQASSKTMQGLLYFLDLSEDKIELQSKLKALKLEYQKVAAQRDKKLIVQQKLGDEGMKEIKKSKPTTTRNQSQKPKEKSVDKGDKNQKMKQSAASRQSNRANSANQRSQNSSKLVAIDPKDLEKQTPKKLVAVGPDGKKEEWQVNPDN